jgi:hypothetical protein
MPPMYLYNVVREASEVGTMSGMVLAPMLVHFADEDSVASEGEREGERARVK